MAPTKHPFLALWGIACLPEASSESLVESLGSQTTHKGDRQHLKETGNAPERRLGDVFWEPTRLSGKSAITHKGKRVGIWFLIDGL